MENEQNKKEQEEANVDDEEAPRIAHATSIEELLSVVDDMEKRYGRPFLPNYPLGEESGVLYGKVGLKTILEKVARGEENVWAIPGEYGIREKVVEIFEFGKAIGQGIKESLLEIETNFEKNDTEEENLTYHNGAHSRGVIDGVTLILSAIRKGAPDLVSERDMDLARFAAAYHDSVQKWRRKETSEGEFTKITRERLKVENERESVLQAIAYMDKENEKAGKEIFSASDKEIIREAIEVTIPDFNIEHKTVVQPNLRGDSSIITRAIALADLGTAGMKGKKEFSKEGDALFREENLDILSDRKKINKLKEEKKEYYRSRMLAWTKSQAQFARGREALLDEELQGLSKEAKEEVKALFSHFDESIHEVEELARRREGMSLEEIVRDMGYFA